MIAGGGIPMDAVVVRFRCRRRGDADARRRGRSLGRDRGAGLAPSSRLLPACRSRLLHGSQPDVFVVCHDPSAERACSAMRISRCPVSTRLSISPLRLGRRTNPAYPLRAVSASIRAALQRGRGDRDHVRRSPSASGLPVADPMRGGPAFEALDSCMSDALNADSGRGPLHALGASGPRVSRRS